MLGKTRGMYVRYFSKTASLLAYKSLPLKYDYWLVYRCFSLPNSPTIRLLNSNSISAPTAYATPV